MEEQANLKWHQRIKRRGNVAEKLDKYKTRLQYAMKTFAVGADVRPFTDHLTSLYLV